MHLECHAALGWVIGNVGAGGAAAVDRRVRNYAVVAAILPDIDALPYLLGPYYYGLYHHTFGHNVFLWALVAAWGAWRFGSWRAGVIGFVAFGSHLLTDAFLSNWFLYLFWPVWGKGFLPKGSLELSSPVNTWLLYLTPVWLTIVGLIWKRTPLEWISPTLDRVFVSFFQRKRERCAMCERGANVRCESCERPVCPRHLQVAKGWGVRCPECRKSQRNGA